MSFFGSGTSATTDSLFSNHKATKKNTGPRMVFTWDCGCGARGTCNTEKQRDAETTVHARTHRAVSIRKQS